MKPATRHPATLLLLLVVLFASTGCGLRFLGDSHAQLIEAEQRLVISSPANFQEGRNVPPQVLCAEPSPDVAKALSESFNISGALSAAAKSQNLPNQGAISAATDISRAHAQAVAQLTNRLTTIQLLRDTLYRACEAYRNGALSEITYAIILSRFDKFVVTMLMGELVAGNFGQPLAILGTSAAGAGKASLEQTQKSADDSKDTLDQANKTLQQKNKELEAAQKELEECQKKNCAEGELKDKQKAVEAKQKGVSEANGAFLTVLADTTGNIAAGVASNASVLMAQGVGAINRSQADVQKTLEAMQGKYLENINADPLIVSCLTAFDRERKDGPNAGRSAALVQFCATTLPKVINAQQELLKARLIAGPSELAAHCLAAYRNVSSINSNVSAAAKPLKEFCDKHFNELVQMHAEWTLKAKQLEEATLQLGRSGAQAPIPDKTGGQSKTTP